MAVTNPRVEGESEPEGEADTVHGFHGLKVLPKASEMVDEARHSLRMRGPALLVLGLAALASVLGTYSTCVLAVIAPPTLPPHSLAVVATLGPVIVEAIATEEASRLCAVK